MNINKNTKYRIAIAILLMAVIASVAAFVYEKRQVDRLEAFYKEIDDEAFELEMKVSDLKSNLSSLQSQVSSMSDVPTDWQDIFSGIESDTQSLEENINEVESQCDELSDTLSKYRIPAKSTKVHF